MKHSTKELLTLIVAFFACGIGLALLNLNYPHYNVGIIMILVLCVIVICYCCYRIEKLVYSEGDVKL
jgi:4-hydroxybenzoate polyprenyltransferase